jgi:diaminohydroxyphosphoribosylaminopyrimidine deaminase/5-amino-6-(5-phosphoribosylamino)uracil reductase
MGDFMGLAFRLAKKANPFPNPRVGAVLVKNNKVIGTGYHRKAGMPHAEIEAIREAKDARGAALYVTLEPCSHTNKRTPPCAQAIIKSGIKKVVYAMKDPNPLVNGEKELKKAGIRVIGPVNEKKARSINSEYLKKPFVAIKMAMSADGKTATRTGDSKWITGEKSRGHVQKMRGEFEAVVVGAGTIKADNPRLTCRMKGRKSPWRIIVDSDLCISPRAKVLAPKDGKTMIATTERASERKMKQLKESASILVLGKKQVDMEKLIQVLGSMGMKKILIEGGGELNASALDAGIVDRLYLFMAPKLIGGRNAKGVVGGRGIEKLSQALNLRLMRTKRFGEDLLLEFDVRKA